jgi:hypothetical protein
VRLARWFWLGAHLSWPSSRSGALLGLPLLCCCGLVSSSLFFLGQAEALRFHARGFLALDALFFRLLLQEGFDLALDIGVDHDGQR